MEISNYLAETEEFRKEVDLLIKGKNIKEKVYRFLAYDFERGVAKKVYAKTKEKIEKEVDAEMKKEAKGKKSPGKGGKNTAKAGAKKSSK